MLSLVTPIVTAANHQLNPEQVPSLEERIEAVAGCLGGALPPGIISLIAKQTMERFDSEIFGFQQWIDCWGAIPVTLPPIEKLRDQVLQMITSTGKQPGKKVEEMGAEECANFLGLQGEREHVEPTEELYECLNRRVRPQDKSVAGFTCVATYIPQYIRKDNRILSVTVRTLALDLGPNPTKGEAAKLVKPDKAFNAVLAPEDVYRTEPSCYFVMERDVAIHTKGKNPSVLIEEMSKQGDKGWRLPELRNFFAAVFSRRTWKGQFLFGIEPPTYAYGQGKSRSGHFLALGSFRPEGLCICDIGGFGVSNIGASGSRKFIPRFIQ